MAITAAHTVVIKGVKQFVNNASQEYSDLDIVQMSQPEFGQGGENWLIGSGGAISSTQILSGPYGGRVVAEKKKAVKKRMGGF